MQKSKKYLKQKHITDKQKQILLIYTSCSTNNLDPIQKHTLFTKNKILKNIKKNQTKLKQSYSLKLKTNKNNKTKEQQFYQKIEIGRIKNGVSSQIQFSSYEQTQKNMKKSKKNLFINCDQKALIKQIWTGDKKQEIIKNQAAIKIQKIFRGYMTRKLLTKYMQKYQQKLIAKKQQIIHMKSIFSIQNDQFTIPYKSYSFFPSIKKLSNSRKKSQISDRSKISIDQQKVFFNDEQNNKSLRSSTKRYFECNNNEIYVFSQKNANQISNFQQKQIDIKNEISQDNIEQLEFNLRKQVYKFELQSQQQNIQQQKQQLDKQKIVQKVLNKLYWQFMQQVISSSKLNKIINNKTSQIKLQSIKLQQQIAFLRLTLTNLPNYQQMYPRLNQKMYPNVNQLLMSMRQLQEDTQIQYYQIGQYQYILNQQICYQALDRYFQNQKFTKTKIKIKQQIHIPIQFRFQFQQFTNQKINKLLLKNKLIHLQKNKEIFQLKKQIQKIQLLCLLDFWNQQLIKQRQDKNGYSGIGMTEVSLSLQDRICKKIKNQTQYRQLMQTTANSIINDLSRQNSNQKLKQQFQKTICYNDSQWILYTQTAIQTVFDIVQMIQLQLFKEFHHQIQKIQKLYQNKSNDEIYSNNSSDFIIQDEHYQDYEVLTQIQIWKKQKYENQEDSFYD